MEGMEGMPGEVASALISTIVTSPIVAIFDKAIFSHASGKMSYAESFTDCTRKLLENPISFFKSGTFLFVWAVYASTFIASNCTDRYAKLHNINAPKTVFLVTAATNISMSVLKDRYLTRLYAILTPKPVPLGSIICYVLRDVLTISGSFTVVKPCAGIFEYYGFADKTSLFMSQMICPIAAQLINTPVFLLGMDLYNRPYASRKERFKYISRNYWKTYYWARMARVGPAFSFGGVLNLELRSILTPEIPARQKIADKMSSS